MSWIIIDCYKMTTNFKCESKLVNWRIENHIKSPTLASVSEKRPTSKIIIIIKYRKGGGEIRNAIWFLSTLKITCQFRAFKNENEFVNLSENNQFRAMANQNNEIRDSIKKVSNTKTKVIRKISLISLQKVHLNSNIV